MLFEKLFENELLANWLLENELAKPWASVVNEADEPVLEKFPA